MTACGVEANAGPQRLALGSRARRGDAHGGGNACRGWPAHTRAAALLWAVGIVPALVHSSSRSVAGHAHSSPGSTSSPVSPWAAPWRWARSSQVQGGLEIEMPSAAAHEPEPAGDLGHALGSGQHLVVGR